jgi:hypothetical protein
MVNLKFILEIMLLVLLYQMVILVILEYIVTNVEAANGASTFTLSTTIGGFSNLTIKQIQMLKVEQKQKLKSQFDLMHHYNYSAQNRAVTTSDYESISSINLSKCFIDKCLGWRR